MGGMVFPVSTHNYELRYWLAAGGIYPGYYAPHKGDTAGQIDAQALLSVTPPPQMPAMMEAGTIYGYCVGEPWNQQAVFKGIGVPVITDYEIWKNNPEKVFGVSQGWADKYPNTHIRVVKALIRAAMWLDENDNANRPEAVKILAKSNYVGADEDVLANSMTGTFEYEKVTSATCLILMCSSATTPLTHTTVMLFGTSHKCAAGVKFQRLSLTIGIKRQPKKFINQRSMLRLLKR